LAPSISIAEAHTAVKSKENICAREPPLKKILALSTQCYAVYILILAVLRDYWYTFRNFGDNQPYVTTAEGIRSWNFGSIKEWQFFGLPYVMVAFSFLIRPVRGMRLRRDRASDRLWGGWVAGVFAVSSRDWMERAIIGGQNRCSSHWYSRQIL